MTENPDKKPDLAQTLLEDTARRLQRNLPEGAIDLAAFGVRPRIGQVLDRMLATSLTESHDPVSIGPYDFDAAALTLREEGRVLRLTEKERDILLALLAAPERRVERGDMLGKVWGYASGVETHTLETHVYRLRQKIEIDPAKPVIILTDGDGYRLA
jgi:DNA-binding response OmpR family regulator